MTSAINIPLGYGGKLVTATFVARPNRFVVEAQLDDQLVLAHLADRGRLTETLRPGTTLLLAQRGGAQRKTAWQAVGAYAARWPWQTPGQTPVDELRLVSLDTQLPNRLLDAALRAGELVPFAHFGTVRREVRAGTSRFDFQLENATSRCTLEVKSAGLIHNGVALFPDAPTTRGRRHLGELGALVASGERAAVVFVAQGQADTIAMHTMIDPAFAAELQRVQAFGVEVYGYTCPLSPTGIRLGPAIPVILAPPDNYSL
jgi:sugar fermentation stimulation protein A